MFKKTKLAFALISVGFMTVACQKKDYLNLKEPTKNEISSSEIISMETSENVLETDSVGLLNLVNDKETFILYVGRPNCEDCKEFFPILDNKLSTLSLKVRFYNTLDQREKDESQLNKDIAIYKINTVPTLISFVRGEESSRLEGVNDEKTTYDWLEQNKEN